MEAKKYWIALALVVAFLLSTVVVRATILIPAADPAKEKGKAPEHSPVINETESGDWELERIDFVHYAKPEHPGKPPKKPKGPSCFKLLGPKWKSFPVAYVVNPTGSGLTEEFVITTVSTSAETWDSETSTELFGNEPTLDYGVKYGNQDFVNAIAFGDHPDVNVIAVTSIWYTPRGRRIVEFDILFDTDWVWGNAEADLNKMDLQNIATHELGHGAGLGDIYNDVCSEVTMYGYSKYGETKKRTLEPADITGIQKLYGE